MTEELLTQLLKDAAAAHHTYEQNIGHPDENWPAWYAHYIIDQLK